MARAMPSAIGGKGRSKQLVDIEGIERAVLAPLGRIHRVIVDGAILRHELVGQGVAVAAGALEPDHVPDVVDGRPLARHHQRLLHRIAAGVAARLAVRLDDEAMGGEPGGMPAAAGERPDAGDAEAALYRDRLGVVVRGSAPGQHAARIFP